MWTWAREQGPTAPGHTYLGTEPRCQTLLTKTTDLQPHKCLADLL